MLSNKFTKVEEVNLKIHSNYISDTNEGISVYKEDCYFIYRWIIELAGNILFGNPTGLHV